MKGKNIYVAIAILLLLTVVVWVLALKQNSSKPQVKSESTLVEVPTDTPLTKPKTFQFDASTDLEAELEKVDTKVKTEDFE